jgi:hypothetical protein
MDNNGIELAYGHGTGNGFKSPHDNIVESKQSQENGYQSKPRLEVCTQGRKVACT